MSAAPANRASRLLATLAKAVVAAGLLAVVFRGVALDELSTILSRVSFAAFMGAAALQVAGFALGALRWWLMAHPAGVTLGFRDLFASFYLGVFANLFLPTGIGGDVVRVLHARRMGADLQPLIAATAADRIVGLCAVFATGLTALALFPEAELAEPVRWLLHGIAAAAAAAIVLFATDRSGAAVARLAERFRHTRLRRAAIEILHSVHQLRGHKARLILAFALSVGVQMLVALAYWTLAQSLGVGQPAFIYFLVVPVVLLAAAVPISLGGLGVREGVFVLMLVWAGTGQAAALSVSLTYLASLWVASLPGAVLWLTARRAARGTGAASP